MRQSNIVPLESLVPAIDRLKSRQLRVFLGRYIADGVVTGNYDAESATRIAYPKSSRSSNAVKVRALQILARKSVKRILDLHFQKGTVESALDEVRRLVKKSLRVNRNVAGRKKLVAALNRVSAALEKSNG